MKRVTEGFLEFVSNFIDANKKFKIKYHNSKLFKNLEPSGHI
jgi:hypothetical protein